MWKTILRLTATCSIAAITGSLFAQDKLSGGDKKWMEKEVGAIITAQETATFQQIKKDDRKLFKELFWKRRDMVSTTDKNEFREIFEQRVKAANDNRQFRARGSKGSETEMGKIFVLLGPPTRMEAGRTAGESGVNTNSNSRGGGGGPNSGGANPAGQGAGASQQRSGGGGGRFTTWIYEAKRGSLTPNGLAIEFRQQQRFGYRILNWDDIKPTLENAKQFLVFNTEINYALNDKGRLEKISDKFNPNSPAKLALAALRETRETTSDVDFAVNPFFFESNEGATFVPIDFQVMSGVSGRKATFFGAIENADGMEIMQFEESGALSENSLGKAGYEQPFQLMPGVYTMFIGVMDPTSNVLGTQIIDFEVPDFNTDKLIISSVVMYQDRESVGQAQPMPGKAFMLAGAHLTPKRTSTYNKSEDLQGLFFAYNYETKDSPRLTVQYAFWKGDESRGQTKAEPVNLINENFAISPFGIPLSIPNFKDPGDYRIQIKLTDQNTGDTATESINFTIGGE